MAMFFTHRYIYDNNKKNIYMFMYKKSNLLEGTLFAVWKIRQCFSQSEHRDKLNPSPPLPSPVCFNLLFKDLPHSLHNKPFIKKGLLEEMEGVNDNASAFMDLNIKANK